MTKIHYRPDIDGLRAVSILAVVAYHADVPFAAGGFVGVDVFFVISGYLITSLLAKELMESGRIDLLRFWARRIRRLLPSALAVIVVSAALATQILPPYDLRTAGEDIIAASAYFLNWELALRAVDYLAEGERHSLYLHFWSLSVEEQFYAFWPIFLMALTLAAGRIKLLSPSRTLAHLAVAVLLGIICSFLFSLHLTGHSQPMAFFGTMSRAWQLLVGALLAIAHHFAAPAATRRLLAFGGGFLIALAVVLYSKDTPYPGVAAVVPVCGAAMIILAGHCRTDEPHVVSTWLSLPAMVFIGRISYAWYLWHWPVLLLGNAYLQGAGHWQRAILVGASFVLAIFTYFLIERPFRSSPVLASSSVKSIGMGILIIVVGLLTGFGLKSIKGEETITVADGLVIDPHKVRNDVPALYRDGCHLDRLAKTSAPCVYGDLAGNRTLVLFGDSHAAQWFPALDTAARNTGWRLVSRTRSVCPSIEVRTWSRQLNREVTECPAWRNTVLAEMARIKPDLVILANQSRYRPIDEFGDVRKGEKRLRALRDGELLIVEAIRSASNSRLVLLRDTPQLPEDPLDCFFRRRADRCAWARDAVLGAETFPFANYAGQAGTKVLDFSNLICDPRSCPAFRDGLIVMRDDNHLTASFANSLAVHFEHLLREYSTRH